MNREKCTLVPTDKLKEMQAEITEQCRIIGMSGEREARLLARVEELERENEALRKDAERYRFLKDQNDDKHNQFAEFVARHYGLEWDSIIDTAMRGQ